MSTRLVLALQSFLDSETEALVRKTFSLSHRTIRALYAWIGFPAIAVPYQRDARFAGSTKWKYWKLWNLAIEGLTSYSTMPMKLAGMVGVLIAMTALGYGAFIFAKTLFLGDPVPGYPSLIVVISFMGGVQLLSLGVIGEYLARVFNETKSRPLYFSKEYHPSSHAVHVEPRCIADGNTAPVRYLYS